MTASFSSVGLPHPTPETAVRSVRPARSCFISKSPGLRPALSSAPINAQGRNVEADGGIAVLPCFLAGPLTRVLPQIDLSRRLWVSTHQEVAATARVRAVRDWLNGLVAGNTGVLMGRGV